MKKKLEYYKQPLEIQIEFVEMIDYEILIKINILDL